MSSFHQYIYYSYTGKAEHRCSYGFCTPDSHAELRRWAYSLWYDLRMRQKNEGRKPTAAVWIGETRYRPAQAEIDEYNERVLKALEEDKFYKRVDSEFEEPPDMDDEDGSSSSAEVEDTVEDESSEDDEPTSITLEDDDALDF